jgi:hypothetical protein
VSQHFAIPKKTKNGSFVLTMFGQDMALTPNRGGKRNPCPANAGKEHLSFKLVNWLKLGSRVNRDTCISKADLEG